MNIYLISRTTPADYGEYEGAVVIASRPSTARAMHPNEEIKDWDEEETSAWVSFEQVKVTYLGKAQKGSKSGIVLASFIES